MGAKLATIRATNLHSAKSWADAFEAEALKLRFILPSVIGVNPDGTRGPISQSVYTSHDDLRNAPVIVETDPKNNRAVMIVILDRPFGEIVRTPADRRPDKSFDALFPHMGGPHTVGVSGDPVEEWLRHAKKELERTRLEATQKTALEEAVALVDMSRIVPTPQSRDGVVGLAASSGSGVI